MKNVYDPEASAFARILLSKDGPCDFLREWSMAAQSGPESAFGRRLAHWRTLRGFTQAELAERIGVSQRVVCYYERETRYPPSHLLLNIAETLQVSLEELIGSVALKDESIPKNTRLKRKLELVESLDPQDQKAIVRMIDAFVARRELGRSSGSGSNGGRGKRNHE